MYFDTSILRSGRAILFQRLLPKLGSQAHFNTMCFSFSAKMAADTNQLKELRECLRTGDEDSAKRLIQTLNPSSVVDFEKVDFTKLPKDILGTSLIPDIDDANEPGHRVALQATGNGNCLYNSTSLCLCGDESRSNSLRLLVASELYFHAEYYATHEVFKQTAQLTEISESVLFPVALTASGDKALTDGGTTIDAVKAEAVATCEDKEWASLIHMMALASVIGRPVYSLYPEVNFRYRPLMMNLLKPRRSHAVDTLDKPVYFLWSRDGDLDNRPNAWYKPNHIVAVTCVPDAQHKDDVKMPTKSTGAKQSTLFAFLKPPSSSVKPGAKRKVHHGPAVLPEKIVKKSEEKVGLDDRKEVTQRKPSTNRKFLRQWQEQFNWVVYNEDENKMTCKTCCAFPHLAGKTEFLVGCRTFKKESLQKHNVGGGHLRARDAFLAKQQPVQNSPIAQGLQKGGKAVEEKSRKDMEAKFNTAYLVAKEELPFTKYQAILSLQKKNGLDISTTYANDKSCNNFVAVISEAMTEQLASEINEKKYIGIMIDGATDASGKENETVHCRFVKDGQPVNRLVGHKAVAHAHAQGDYILSIV